MSLKKAILQSFILNFIFSMFTHHYFLFVVLSFTYSQPSGLISPLTVTLLLPMAGKLNLHLYDGSYFSIC